MSMIKPCPFCGDRGRKRTIDILEYDNNKEKPGYPFNETGKIFKRRMIECRNPNCYVQPSTWLYLKTDDFNDAIEKWNIRLAPKKN